MGQISKTIQILVTAGIWAGAVVLVSGCEDTASKPGQANGSIRSDVTDVRPLEPVAAVYQPPVYDTSAVVPTSPQAVTVDPVMASSKVTPMMSTTPDSGKTHVVQRGETLFSIAKVTYGDGKQWQKIVAVNPGVSPSKLKVGQVLAMP